MRFIALVFVVLLLPSVAAAQMLPQAPTKLIVKSEPGAAVYLDGALVGTVEQNGQLILTLKESGPRQRELRVTLAGRRPFEQRVTITPEQATEIVAKLSEFVGRLEVLTTPEAEVLLDGRSAGKADARGRLELRSVRAGRVRLQIRRPGFLPEKRTVTISANELTTLVASLTDIASPSASANELTTLVASLTDIASPSAPAQQAPDFVPHRSLVGHTASVYAVAFSADSRWVASGDRDGGMRLWEVSSGRQLRAWELGPYTINTVAFSRDGRLLAGAPGNAQR